MRTHIREWYFGRSTHSGGVPCRLNSSKCICTLSLGSALNQVFVRNFVQHQTRLLLPESKCALADMSLWIKEDLDNFSYISCFFPFMFRITKREYQLKMKIPGQWRFHFLTLEKLSTQNFDRKLKLELHRVYIKAMKFMYRDIFWKYATIRYAFPSIMITWL